MYVYGKVFLIDRSLRAQITVVYSNPNYIDLIGVIKQHCKPLTSYLVRSVPSKYLPQFLLAFLYLIAFMMLHIKLDGINHFLT